MQAIQITAPGETQFVEVDIPALKPGHALIRTQRLSLCGSDIFFLHHMPADFYPAPVGATGHEVVGEVMAVDAPGSGIQVGDVALVIAPEQTAMAEYYLARVENVLRLPPGRPIEELLQAQQLGTVIYACRQLPNVVGKDVAVVGQGSAGLWFDFMLRRLGARRVMAIDLQAHRLAAGRLYGATDTIHNGGENAGVDVVAAVAGLTQGEMVDVAVVAAGEVEAVNLAVLLLKMNGLLFCFGVPHEERFVFDYGRFFLQNLQAKAVVGAYNEPGHASTWLAMEMIANGTIDVAPILTHRFPFAQVAAAYELQRTRDEGAIKIVVEMP